MLCHLLNGKSYLQEIPIIVPIIVFKQSKIAIEISITIEISNTIIVINIAALITTTVSLTIILGILSHFIRTQKATYENYLLIIRCFAIESKCFTATMKKLQGVR